MARDELANCSSAEFLAPHRQVRPPRERYHLVLLPSEERQPRTHSASQVLSSGETQLRFLRALELRHRPNLRPSAGSKCFSEERQVGGQSSPSLQSREHAPMAPQVLLRNNSDIVIWAHGLTEHKFQAFEGDASTDRHDRGETAGGHAQHSNGPGASASSDRRAQCAPVDGGMPQNAGISGTDGLNTLSSSLGREPDQRQQGHTSNNDHKAVARTSQEAQDDRGLGHDDAPFGIRGGSALTRSDSARAKSHRSDDHTPMPSDVESSVIISVAPASKDVEDD